MAGEQTPVPLGNCFDGLSPGGLICDGVRALIHLTVDPIHHEIDEFRLAGDVGVERHRSDLQPLGELAHGQVVDACLVGERDPCVEDGVQADTRPPSPVVAVPEQGDRLQGIASSSVFNHVVSILITREHFSHHARYGTVYARMVYDTMYGGQMHGSCH